MVGCLPASLQSSQPLPTSHCHCHCRGGVHSELSACSASALSAERLRRAFAKVQAGGKLTVTALGGSVTAGLFTGVPDISALHTGKFITARTPLPCVCRCCSPFRHTRSGGGCGTASVGPAAGSTSITGGAPGCMLLVPPVPSIVMLICGFQAWCGVGLATGSAVGPEGASHPVAQLSVSTLPFHLSAWPAALAVASSPPKELAPQPASLQQTSLPLCCSCAHRCVVPATVLMQAAGSVTVWTTTLGLTMWLTGSGISLVRHLLPALGMQQSGGVADATSAAVC